MGIFRAKTVYDVRLYYIDDFSQHRFQIPVILFRTLHILRKAIAGKGGVPQLYRSAIDLLSFRKSGLIHGKRHGK